MQQAGKVSSLQPMDKVSSSILSSLLYFSVFNHPLTAEEIKENVAIPAITQQEIISCLNELVIKGMIYRMDYFYAIHPDITSVKRRIKGNQVAKVYLQRAKWVSRFISWFPFVRGVMISGSLSKGYMDKGSDIDYFIVTEKGRLWVCRSFLAALRKVMIGPFRKYFCINYFIDNASLSIPDHNLFTATEIAFVHPTYNASVHQTFIEKNPWIREYYPNKNTSYDAVNSRPYKYSIKVMVEWCFKGSIGEALDTWLFRFMLKRWKKRYNTFDEQEFDLNIRTKKHVSKQHEKGHQFIVLKKYQEQVAQYEHQHQVTLQHV
jgi:hypothetical protein